MDGYAKKVLIIKTLQTTINQFCEIQTCKYLAGIPGDSRAVSASPFLNKDTLSEAALNSIKELNSIAERTGQTLAQMAIAWVLSDSGKSTALIGASKASQVIDSVGAIDNLEFSAEELALIDRYASESKIEL